MATQIYLGMPPENIKKFIEENYGPKEDPMLKTPLHFVADEPNATMCFSIENGTYETSTTGEEGSWTPYISNTTITLVNVGDKVYFRAGSDEGNETCRDSQFYIGKSGYTNTGKITAKGKIAAKGNIQSLLDRKMERMDVPEHCYYYMFYGCKSLTQAPALPATTLAYACYENMFEDCTALTQAPVLPATTLANACYNYMFGYCSSLTNAYFPNLDSNTIIDEVVGNHEAFNNAASNIETQCLDTTIIINSTSV